jgi:hypothetical protein
MVLVTVVTSLMLRARYCGFSREIKNKFNKTTHKTKENN